MKVAILTFHNTPNNCGAVLQAYALQRTLEKLGHVAEIIDYYRERGDMKPWWSFKSIGGVYHTVKMLIVESLRLGRCRRFRRCHLNLTLPEYGGRVRYRGADAYITGSDQVFNPIHNEGNPDFLLDFVPSGKRRIAYGASFGADVFDEAYTQVLKKHLPLFDALSVREEKGAETIKAISGRTAQVVADPTLLLDEDEYRPLMGCARVRVPADPYVFIYLIGNHPDARRIAREKAGELGAKKIILMTNGRAEWHWPQFGMVKRLYIFTPADFLKLVSNAAYVVTNSFHGTAFSTIFHRQFTSLKNGTAGDARMATLLETLRSIGIEKYRASSIEFLKEATK